MNFPKGIARMVTSAPMENALGEFIKKRLQQLDMSQKDLADRTNMAPAQISRVISGDRGTRLENLYAIADALRMKRRDLLSIAAGESPEQDEDPFVKEAETLLRLLRRGHLRRSALRSLAHISYSSPISQPTG